MKFLKNWILTSLLRSYFVRLCLKRRRKMMLTMTLCGKWKIFCNKFINLHLTEANQIVICFQSLCLKILLLVSELILMFFKFSERNVLEKFQFFLTENKLILTWRKVLILNPRIQDGGTRREVARGRVFWRYWRCQGLYEILKTYL